MTYKLHIICNKRYKPISKHNKSLKSGSFYSSKWPHLHRTYLVTVCNLIFVAVNNTGWIQSGGFPPRQHWLFIRYINDKLHWICSKKVLFIFTCYMKQNIILKYHLHTCLIKSKINSNLNKRALWFAVTFMRLIYILHKCFSFSL